MKNVLSGFLGLALLVSGLWLCWQWGFCRFYVGPNEMAVITAKTGTPLPPGQILARRGQQGVQEEVLGEGRHFLNPMFFEHRVLPVTIIPAGKVGVVTSKVGTELPAGEFLAQPGQKGIWRQVLGPGKYRLNPAGYDLRIADAISVPIGYVGVLSSLSGRQSPEGQFAGPNEKGVRADILQPGLYYINPAEVKVDVLEIGVNQVSLLGRGGGAVITKTQIATQNRAIGDLDKKALSNQFEQRADYLSQGASLLSSVRRPASRSWEAEGASSQAPAMAQKQRAGTPPARASKPRPSGPQGQPNDATFVLNQFVEFPSKDGFEISLDMTVEFELLPEHIAWIFRSYGDLPAAVDKVIMPQILSISRLKGSAYGAKDFIVGEGREKFQSDLTEALARTLGEKRIIVHNALIRHVNVPQQILEPIQQASIAVEQDLTNKERQNTAKKQAELNTELSLIEQRREQVAQETTKLRAEIAADQTRQVAQLGGETLKQVAELERQAAAVKAEKTTKLGRAEAEVVRLVEGEKAAGAQLRVKAFGDAAAYNLWTFATSLNEKMTIGILPTGPGTLWTDLGKAQAGELGGATLLREGRGKQ